MAVSVPALPLQKAELTGHRRPLTALTGIRFFAALFVVIFHSRVAAFLAANGLPYASNFFANGYMAVTLFFVLSGFILAYTYRSQIETPQHRLRFWQARFARIWPVYALSFVCVSVPFLSSIPPPGRALATLLMVQAWNPLHSAYAGDWNFSCWTLSVEALFYFTFPWFQVRLERLSRRWLLTLGAILLLGSTMARIPTRALGVLYQGVFRFIPLPVIFLPVFLVGMILGNLYLEDNASTALRGSGLFTWIGSLVVIVSLCLPFQSPATSFVLIGYTILVYGLAAEPTFISRLLSTPLLILGGGMSYSMYLMQLPVRFWVKPVFAAAKEPDGFWNMVVVIVVLLLFSWVTFQFVEEPARKWLRSKFAAADRKLERQAELHR